MRERVKATAAGAAALLPQCRYDRAIFVLAHMRCGSTALANVLCSRPDISGYGEAHVRYTSRASLGQLVVNQALRGAWKPGARHLFDKLLHNRHDGGAPPDFFRARAIFVLREPRQAVRSIRELYTTLGRTNEYRTDAETAAYYIERLAQMRALWARFPADRRIGIAAEAMLADPDATLSQLTARFGLSPALENRYVSPKASRKGGGGDPLTSGKFERIEPRRHDPAREATVVLDLGASELQSLADAHAETLALIAG